MRIYKFRDKRIRVGLEIEVSLQNRKSGSRAREHLPTMIINISQSGACIEIERVHLNGEHIFFTSMERGDNNLYLQGIPFKDGSIDLAATAVWMDKGVGESRRFRIGMKFLEQQKELFNYLKSKS